MIMLKKFPLSVLILAVMLSSGGACLFPMLTAQASSGAMDMGDLSFVDEQDEVVMTHDTSSVAHLPPTQDRVKTCITTGCEQARVSLGTIKKVTEFLALPILALQGEFAPSLLVDVSDLVASESPESSPLQEALLSVAKRE